jgi:hypothetical protein
MLMGTAPMPEAKTLEKKDARPEGTCPSWNERLRLITQDTLLHCRTRFPFPCEAGHVPNFISNGFPTDRMYVPRAQCESPGIFLLDQPPRGLFGS